MSEDMILPGTIYARRTQSHQLTYRVLFLMSHHSRALEATRLPTQACT